MSRVRRWIGAGLIAALCGSPAMAEDLMQVYRQALESDPVLKAAVANRDAAQEAKPQARALLLPSVGINADQSRSSVSGQTDLNTHTYALSVQQPIYNRGNLVQQRLADAVIGQSDVDLRNTENTLILRVSQGYFGVLAALDDLTYATAEKNAFARQLEQANRRFEVGLATITDVYDAQARFDAAVSQEIAATNTLADARESLRQLTGQEYARLNLLSEQMPLTLPKPTDPEAWVRMALDNNLQLLSAGFTVEQARQNIQLQKAGHYPTLSLQAVSADFDTDVISGTRNEVGLQLAIPLYTGGAVSSRSRQAAYTYEASRQTLENLQRDTIRTVRNAYRGQETAISQIKALDQTRGSTRSALEANQAGYEVGTRTIVDVLDAERNVYLAARNYAAARYSYIANYLTLRQAAGQLSEADVAEINGWLGGPRSTSDITAALESPTKAPGSGAGLEISAKPMGEAPISPPPSKSRSNGKPAHK